MAAEKLRDLSQPIDVALLDATVAAFYGTRSKDEKTAADHILWELQNNPDMWLQVVHILSSTQSLNTKFFALQCGDFLPWLRHKSGAEISSVLSIGKSIYGRSLFACKPIQAGDCILKVPYSVQLAPDNLHPSINSLLGEDVGNVAKLALVILLHQRLAEASEWAPLHQLFATCRRYA
ncbi:putative armadillo-like helical protein [Helianthus annuus]|nr:putative armadillo-like helical protein [Helianthus annuus]